ncbi:MAG: V-type ATP synthase subunit A [Promethearchaeia archaeon]
MSESEKSSELEEENNFGYISAVKGSVIEVKGLETDIRLHDLIKIEEQNIIGEVLQILKDRVVVRCFQDTNELQLKEKVKNLHEPLSMELAPGLLSNVFDGIQRPLEDLYKRSERVGFLERGLDVPALSRTKKWHFTPSKSENDHISEGDIIGVVQETESISHKIMVPFGEGGQITMIAEEGEYTIDEEIYCLKTKGTEKSYNMVQKWPIMENRPFYKKLNPDVPLQTGIRVIDLLFPVAKGGCVAIPGAVGTGKTVIQQSIAKFSDADIIIFVGCGIRGNEMANILEEFSKLTDPWGGRPLMERTVLIANTPNMPVSARESSIFSGITIAEYYRDMGYNVTLLADSTSRWAEALRELSALLEEMPAEEGYPAYLPSRLSAFYERAGVIMSIGNTVTNKRRTGSLSIIGSISPPSGDFSEPVTANTKRFVRAFWPLDANLAYNKHYPAINWLKSYSNYPDNIADWYFEQDIDWSEIDLDWYECRIQINDLLSKEDELKNVAQLVGEQSLSQDQQLTLFVARIIQEGFLIQNAFDDIDNFTSTEKLMAMAKLILLFYNRAKEILNRGVLIEDIKNMDIVDKFLRMKSEIPNDDFERMIELKKEMLSSFEHLRLIYGGEQS